MKLGGMCNCDCHDEGVNVKHCFPCCSYTYIKRKDLDKEIEKRQKQYEKEKKERENEGKDENG